MQKMNNYVLSSSCRCGKIWRDNSQVHFELVVPMFKARDLIPSLVDFIKHLQSRLPCDVFITFVLDGDVDDTKYQLLQDLSNVSFKWKIIKLSRNFGVGPALMAAFENSNACVVSAFGADLQEPAEVFIEFLEILSNPERHIALGVRKSRDDPFFSKIASKVYWYFFTKVISRDLPSGGFDVCALSNEAKNALVSMNEKNTNITAQIDWLGFSREFVFFDRLPRKIGKSSWKLSRKIKLFLDSFYGFTEMPINVLFFLSAIGIFVTSLFGIVIIFSWILGRISVPGYASLVLLQIFSTNLVLFVISVVSGYNTRAFENSKLRPKYIIESIYE